MRTQVICTTMSGGGGYWGGGVNTDFGAELDVNDADADDSHSDSGVAWILTHTVHFLIMHMIIVYKSHNA